MVEHITTIELTVRLLNGIIALACGGSLLYYHLHKERGHFFLGLWSVGFIIWGIQILSRVVFPLESIFVLPLLIIQPFFFIQGIGHVLSKDKPFFLTYLGIVAVIILSYFFFARTYPALFYSIALLYYGFQVIAVIMFVRHLGMTTLFFLLGSILFFFANSLPPLGFSVSVADAISATGKVILLYGMLGPRQAFILWLRYNKLTDKEREITVSAKDRETFKNEPLPSVFAWSFENAVDRLGKSVGEAILYMIKTRYGLTKESMLDRIDQLDKALRKLFGPAGKKVERDTLQYFASCLGANVLPSQTFVQNIKRIASEKPSK